MSTTISRGDVNKFYLLVIPTVTGTSALEPRPATLFDAEGVDFLNDRPAWVHAVKEGLPTWDHKGFVVGTDIVFTGEYGSYATGDMRRLIDFADKYALEIEISGQSPWVLGATTGVYYIPSRETYALLELEPPPHAYCLRTKPHVTERLPEGHHAEELR